MTPHPVAAAPWKYTQCFSPDFKDGLGLAAVISAEGKTAVDQWTNSGEKLRGIVALKHSYGVGRERQIFMISSSIIGDQRVVVEKYKGFGLPRRSRSVCNTRPSSLTSS